MLRYGFTVKKFNSDGVPQSSSSIKFGIYLQIADFPVKIPSPKMGPKVHKMGPKVKNIG